MNERINLSTPHMCGREMAYIKEAFDTNWIAPLGKNVTEFENEICAVTGAPQALAMSAGTAALHMALRSLGVGRGDIVFCSSMTFAASCNPIVYEGGTPVFIDSEPSSWNMSPVALKKAFLKYPKPKAVVVVNLYGQSANYDEILKITEEYGVPVVEDAAESLGATYKGRMTGTIGALGVLSFNGNKIITTSGGGMLLCKTEEEKSRILKWITQSRDPARHYQHSELGFNYRMSNICAGIGRGQLTALSERVAKKTQIYQEYQNGFSDVSVDMMPVCDYGVPSFWLSCMTVRGKDPIALIEALDEHNIESRPIWKPMHLQPYYGECDYFTHDEDVSKRIFETGLCLPSDTKMTAEQQNRVIEIIKAQF